MARQGRQLTAEDFRGFPGLSYTARDALLLLQPATVLDALCVAGVGRTTTRRLLEQGLLTDPEGAQQQVIHRIECDEVSDKRTAGARAIESVSSRRRRS